MSWSVFTFSSTSEVFTETNHPPSGQERGLFRRPEQSAPLTLSEPFYLLPNRHMSTAVDPSQCSLLSADVKHLGARVLTPRHSVCFQVTRPPSYTKRQFDVEEEYVDKLALRWVGSSADSTWTLSSFRRLSGSVPAQGGLVERQQPEVWGRVPGRSASSSAGSESSWSSRRLVRGSDLFSAR